MVSAIKKEEFGKKSISRNPLLFSLFKSVDSYDDEVGYLRGTDYLEVVDMQGLYGTMTESDKKKMVDELNKMLKGNSVAKDIGQAVKLVKGNLIGVAYDILNAQIKKAIANTLSSWVANKTVSGTPQWVDVGYGQLWDVSVKIPTQKVDIYKCCIEQHIFVKDRTETRTFKEKYGKCAYTSPGPSIRYTANLEDLDITGCKSGSCPNAWKDAIEKALNYALTVSPLQGRIVGDCPGS